jgi:hypothetical protein
VEADEVAVEGVLAQQQGGPLGDVEERRAVETVATDAVLLVPLVRQGVHVGAGRHGLVPGRVHDGDVRDVGQDVQGRFDAQDVRGIVEGRQTEQALEGLDRLRTDLDRLGELLAAVDDAVADGRDLLEVVEDADLGIEERVDDELDGLLVVGALVVELDGLAAQAGLVDVALADADPLDDAGGQRFLLFVVVEAVLGGRTAAVEGQDDHG